MSLGVYDPERRYRRRSAERRKRTFQILLLIVLVGGFGYWMGKVSVRSDAAAARLIAQQAEKERDELLAEVTALRARVTETQIISTHLDTRIANQNPAPEALRAPRECQPKETRQLLVGTGEHVSTANNVSFADGLLTVGGSGQPAVDMQGKTQAWFDPGKPVSLQFSIREGETGEKKALLPFEHVVVADGKEHRFSIAAGPQSFVEIVLESCSLKQPSLPAPPLKAEPAPGVSAPQ